jgi:hypothetical protein
MQKIIWILLFLFPVFAGAQPWESFTLTAEGDTLNRIDSRKFRQGPWVVRIESLRGEPGYEEEGFFRDDKKEGTWRKFNLQGDLIAIEQYRWGYRDGKQQYYTMLGELLREESWKAVNPENPYDTIDVPDLNNPMITESKVVKLEGSELRHGTWKFYDPSTGTVLKTETYLLGQKEKSGSSQPMDSGDAAAPKPAAKPKTVEDWEKKNSGKKKVTVRDGRTGG